MDFTESNKQKTESVAKAKQVLSSGSSDCSFADLDPSVVHVPNEDSTYKQAMDWHTLIASRCGRVKMLDWLKRNDPMIANLYRRAEDLCSAHTDDDLAVLLMLAKVMRRPS
jgi:hypothetical protein